MRTTPTQEAIELAKEFGKWGMRDISTETIAELLDRFADDRSKAAMSALGRLLRLCETGFTGWPATLAEVEVRNEARAALGIKR
jgi:hypothetical protein